MVQRRKDFRLALEPRHALAVARECLGQDLQCDIASELPVSRPVHLTHPAHAERPQDLVGSQTIAGVQCHLGQDYTPRTEPVWTFNANRIGRAPLQRTSCRPPVNSVLSARAARWCSSAMEGGNAAA